MKNEKVSIIIPCYNQANYLPEALDSVFAQTYANWECIIINDGSSDNTDIVAQHYLMQDNRFKYIKQSNKGPAAARNAGIEYSCGEFILPLDADDLIEPSYLERALKVFALNPNTKLVYCKADRFGLVNEPWDLEDYNYDHFIWNNCIFCSSMFKRSDSLKAGGYNANMAYGLEDWDFYLSLLDKGDIVYRIDDVLFHYRIKEISRTTELNESRNKMLIQICNNHARIYAPFKERVIIYHQELLKMQQLKSSLESIRSSFAYRLGSFLLKPLFWLKRKCFIKTYFN